MTNRYGIFVLLDDVEAAVGAGLHYVALFGALAIPDLMAALADANGTTSGRKYEDWYRSNVDFPVDAAECYRWRCSMLHQGRSATGAVPPTRIAFAEPGEIKVKTGYVMGSVMLVDVSDFCRAVVTAARRWLESQPDGGTVRRNLETSLRRGAATHGTEDGQVTLDLILVM